MPRTRAARYGADQAEVEPADRVDRQLTAARRDRITGAARALVETRRREPASMDALVEVALASGGRKTANGAGPARPWRAGPARTIAACTRASPTAWASRPSDEPETVEEETAGRRPLLAKGAAGGLYRRISHDDPARPPRVSDRRRCATAAARRRDLCRLLSRSLSGRGSRLKAGAVRASFESRRAPSPTRRPRR